MWGRILRSKKLFWFHLVVLKSCSQPLDHFFKALLIKQNNQDWDISRGWVNRFFSSEWKIFCRALSENMLQPVERHHQGWAFLHTFCKRIVSCCFLCRSYPVLSCHWQKNWLGGTYSELRLVDSVRWLGLSASCGQHKRNISSLNSFHELHRKRPIWRTWLFLPCQWTNRLPNHKSETICLLIWVRFAKECQSSLQIDFMPKHSWGPFYS